METLFSSLFYIEDGMINLLRIVNTNHPLLEELFELYEDAFPEDERRERSVLKSLIYNQSMSFNAILDESIVVGILVYWQFRDFLFVEHFALFSRFRGDGKGSEVLTLLNKQHATILLEVEHPLSDIQKRRQKFYIRNGFHIIDVHYFQPSYTPGGSTIPMTLMCNNRSVEKRDAELFIQKIHREVYHYAMV